MVTIQEEAVRQGKNMLGIIVIIILILLALPQIGDFIKNYSIQAMMKIRQDFIVAPLKGKKITVLFLPSVHYGKEMIDMLQDFFQGMPPPTEEVIEKNKFEIVECHNPLTCDDPANPCTCSPPGENVWENDATVKFLDFNEGEAGRFLFTDFDISPEQQDIVVLKGSKRFSYNYDMMFDYTENNPRVVKGVSDVLYQIYVNMKKCYDEMYMGEEGDPFYRSLGDNPYLCSKTNLTLSDEVPITFEDLDLFLRTTIDPEIGMTYSRTFKPLQLSYCFLTETCIRTASVLNIETGQMSGKVCFPKESLEITKTIKVSQGKTLEDILGQTALSAGGGAVVGGAAGMGVGSVPGSVVGAVAGGVFGFVSGTISFLAGSEGITCDVEMMLEDVSEPVLNNKKMLLYYWDDNGDSSIKLGGKKLKATQMEQCSNTFVISSTYFDYAGRQVDPLVICLEDL